MKADLSFTLRFTGWADLVLTVSVTFMWILVILAEVAASVGLWDGVQYPHWMLAFVFTCSLVTTVAKRAWALWDPTE